MKKKFAAILALTALAIAFFILQAPQAMLHPLNRLWEAGDSVANAWILAWDSKSIFDPSLSIWNAPLMYPAAGALAFCENLIGSLWISLPVQHATGNHVLAFNALVYSSFLFGVLAMALLAFELTSSFLAAALAGLIFSFNPYRWAHIPHVQLMCTYLAPLLLYFLHRLVREKKAAYLWLSATVFVWEYYSSIYMGTMLLAVVVAWLGLAAALWPPARAAAVEFAKSPRWRAQIAAALALSALAMIPLALPYFRITRAWGYDRSIADATGSSIQLYDLLSPPSVMAHYSGLKEWFWKSDPRHECAVFLGIVPWLLSAVAVGSAIFRARRPRLQRGANAAAKIPNKGAQPEFWLYLFLAGFTLAMMFGPQLIFADKVTAIPLPYRIFYYLAPGAKAIRCPARFAQFLLLALGILAAFGIREILALIPEKKWRPAASLGIAASLFAALAWDYALAPNEGVTLWSEREAPPEISYLRQPAGSGRPYLDLPMKVYQVNFMYFHAQTFHWRPTVGLQLSFATPATMLLSYYSSGEPTKQALRLIANSPAMTLVIHLDDPELKNPAAWAAAPFDAYGFERAGLFGRALIWERKGELPRASARLAVVNGRYGAFGDEQTMVQLDVTPADSGAGWRFLSSGLAPFSVRWEDASGARHEYSGRFRPPPFIWSGEAEKLEFVYPVPFRPGDKNLDVASEIIQSR